MTTFQSECLLVGDNIPSIRTSVNLFFTMERVVWVEADVAAEVDISFNGLFGKNGESSNCVSLFILFLLLSSYCPIGLYN
jgi:hypothetical protein